MGVTRGYTLILVTHTHHVKVVITYVYPEIGYISNEGSLNVQTPLM